MGVQYFVQSLTDKLLSRAAVTTVFGEPVIVGEKKIIPVARVACGFGGGAGTGTLPRKTEAPQSGIEGGGGGGGLVAMPVGVVEITPEGTRFIRFGATPRLIGAVAFGLLFGFVFGWSRLRK